MPAFSCSCTLCVPSACMQGRHVSPSSSHRDWSTEGVQTIPPDEGDPLITCITTHVTSFAVLVSVTGSSVRRFACNTCFSIHMRLPLAG